MNKERKLANIVTATGFSLLVTACGGLTEDGERIAAACQANAILNSGIDCSCYAEGLQDVLNADELTMMADMTENPLGAPLRAREEGLMQQMMRVAQTSQQIVLSCVK